MLADQIKTLGETAMKAAGGMFSRRADAPDGEGTTILRDLLVFLGRTLIPDDAYARRGGGRPRWWWRNPCWWRRPLLRGRRRRTRSFADGANANHSGGRFAGHPTYPIAGHPGRPGYPIVGRAGHPCYGGRYSIIPGGDLPTAPRTEIWPHTSNCTA